MCRTRTRTVQELRLTVTDDRGNRIHKPNGPGRRRSSCRRAGHPMFEGGGADEEPQHLDTLAGRCVLLT
jgi:hypothetical protein